MDERAWEQGARGLAATSVTRRGFGRLAGGALAATLVSRPGGARPEPVPHRPLAPSGGDEQVHLVGLSRDADEDQRAAAARRALLAASDLDWLGRGDRVLLKVACNSGNPYPFTTDPAAIRGVVRLLLERGAGRVIVADMSGVQFLRFGPDHLKGSTRKLLTGNRIAIAALDAGATVHAFEEPGWDAFHEEQPRPQPDSAWPTPVMMPDILAEVDHVILMPRCARHVLAGSTLGLKAAVGWWRHDSRLVYHRGGASLPEKTAEANTVPSLLEKQRLVLSSATRVVTTFGPDSGYVLEPETGLIMASRSVVAHDMASLAWLLECRRATPEKARDGLFDDPHQAPFAIHQINRVVSVMLGGLGQFFPTEAPPSMKLETIYDDRVLRRAFEVFGGVPRVAIATEGGVPSDLASGLERAVQRPAEGAA